MELLVGQSFVTCPSFEVIQPLQKYSKYIISCLGTPRIPSQSVIADGRRVRSQPQLVIGYSCRCICVSSCQQRRMIPYWSHYFVLRIFSDVPVKSVRLRENIFHLTKIFKGEDKKWDPFPSVGGLNREFCNNLYATKIRVRVKAEKQETRRINIKNGSKELPEYV